MSETCNPKDCPLVPRVEALERESEKNRESRKNIYERLGKLETAFAVREEQYKTILEKLDCMDEKIDDVRSKADARIDSVNDDVDALEAKPGKRWDSIVDKAIWAVVAAVIAFLLARVGL